MLTPTCLPPVPKIRGFDASPRQPLPSDFHCCSVLARDYMLTQFQIIHNDNLSQCYDEFVSNWLSLVYLPRTKSDSLFLIYNIILTPGHSKTKIGKENKYCHDQGGQLYTQLLIHAKHLAWNQVQGLLQQFFNVQSNISHIIFAFHNAFDISLLAFRFAIAYLCAMSPARW